ncbi:hypothetical protein [Falsirhodobacter sp. alg1]|uniref:hypothetical protein n=1 Tax=Falsirhodobacter sp. alg1 TaxID=1472418 RepID=UPI0005EDFB38|nr:hypothetical protein [Falsirhodobacter sp. alg1]
MIRLACIIALLPVAAAAGSFQPPAGCTTKMTVQYKQCRVSNYYVCTQDAPGDMWRSDSDQQGPFFLSRTNSEGEWMESYDGNDSGAERLDQVNDAGSISNLMATGTDSYDFWQRRSNGSRTHTVGRDSLTGQTEVIDGQSLAQTKYRLTETDEAGNILRESRGNEFISQELGTFFSGSSEHRFNEGEWVASNDRPMSFAFPGEDGFEAGQPIFDCDEVLSGLPTGGSHG